MSFDVNFVFWQLAQSDVKNPTEQNAKISLRVNVAIAPAVYWKSASGFIPIVVN